MKISTRSVPLNIIAMFIIFYVLYIGASLIIPFIIAVLFWFALISLAAAFKKRGVHNALALFLSFATYSMFLYFIFEIINNNINQVIELSPAYESKLVSMFNSFVSYFNLDVSESFGMIFKDFNLSSIIQGVAGSVLSVFGNAGIILIYVIFLLLEHKNFSKKIDKGIGNGMKRRKIKRLIEKISTDIQSYFAIKTFISLLTGFFSYIILLAFGVDFALFWSFLIFLFNFIPTVGSFLAVVFPLALSVVQFESLYIFLGIGASLSAVQVVLGNIVDPKLMGNKLNLSPLLVLISLGFWGAMWGVVGMLLSVPIMVSINIVLSEFKSTRAISVFFSEKGDIKSK